MAMSEEVMQEVATSRDQRELEDQAAILDIMGRGIIATTWYARKRLSKGMGVEVTERGDKDEFISGRVAEKNNEGKAKIEKI